MAHDDRHSILMARRPTCAIVSFRLGHIDGVSVVAATWVKAFEALGFDVHTVAGAGEVDEVVPGLALDARIEPGQSELDRALRGADIVVAENILTIPMNLAASRALAAALRGRRAILHHHDPPWQRERYAHITALPPHDPQWIHVTINELTRRQFAERGWEATTIYNAFDVFEPLGDRQSARRAIDVSPTELLVVHPVRAIARKNIPAALALAEGLGASYWLMGGVEEGYGSELARVLDRARTRVIHQSMSSRADFYAAADLVAFPSIWEGFGNPPIEAAIHRKPAAVSNYPVSSELRTLGFRWFDPDDIGALRAFLARPDRELLDHNQLLARRHFSHDSMRAQLQSLLARAGWLA